MQSPWILRTFATSTLFGAWSLWAGAAIAQEPAENSLPIERVVLFNSGVGFFEHATEVEGDAQLNLKFNVDDINDLLKSMVLQDMGGGTISTVTYGSRDPITKTLHTFAIDLTQNPSMGELLNQARGEKVEVEATTPITGTILGVEKRTQAVADDKVVETEFLNLLTDEGLRSVPLAGVSRIRLLNQKLDQELRTALEVLAAGHATDKKTVTLNFLGQGKRPVRVGYIQESPIWKTSYRLVLQEDQPPLLQGWAIVENTTEEDWTDVGLTLVSGRPISFVMDLYQPLYVPRPVVEPELFASLRPQTYGQDLADAEQELTEQAELAKSAPAAPNRPGWGHGQGLTGFTGEERRQKRKSVESEQMEQTVQSVAQAAEVGELFQYDIVNPVTVGRQQSAMLPIVNGSVEGEKVSIYNAGVHPKHPLNGLRLKNTSGLHLMQGPITVFDGGTYAGDAKIEDLPPDSVRLISYALDLETEVAPEAKPQPEHLVRVWIVKGTLHTTRKFERLQEYRIKNSSSAARTVLIEYPLDATWKLLSPKQPADTTRDLYRFAVTAEPGKPASLAIKEEQVVSQELALTNLDDNSIQYYLRAAVVSDGVKQSLQELIRRRAEVQSIVAQHQQMEQQINVIGQEQARIRENMAQLERDTDLYRRYVKKFGEQEDTVETLRGKVSELQVQAAEKSRQLDEFLLGLELE